MAKFDWKEFDAAKANLLKRAAMLKRAFVQMPGGAPAGDPNAGGMPPPGMGGDPAAGGMPMDPSMAGGMPPPEMGGDPAAGGMPMDPSMLAAMAGGVPPMGVDPATAGMIGGMPPPGADAGAGGALAGAAGAGAAEPTLTLTLTQLWDVVTKVLGLAKKIGANGQGVQAESAQQPALNQDAIKTAVIEALGSMGAMR